MVYLVKFASQKIKQRYLLMGKEEKIIVGISIGDLNGIGGELIIKTFDDNRILDLCTPVIFASTKVLAFLKKHFNCFVPQNQCQSFMKKILKKSLNTYTRHPEVMKLSK